LATEAFITIPFRNQFPLAVRSHFFEFLDGKGRSHLVDQVAEGEEYEVVVTTGGGLCRYRLGDHVRVIGFTRKTPSLAFLGREANVSDYFGEKLSESFVCAIVEELKSEKEFTPRFAMLAPDQDSIGRISYTLYLETAEEVDCGEQLEVLLRRNPHYDHCRKLEQLSPARVFHVKRSGYETFVAQEVENGKKLGEVKPRMLSQKIGWSGRFIGRALESRS
jgi:hypothetical protein